MLSSLRTGPAKSVPAISGVYHRHLLSTTSAAHRAQSKSVKKARKLYAAQRSLDKYTGRTLSEQDDRIPGAPPSVRKVASSGYDKKRTYSLFRRLLIERHGLLIKTRSWVAKKEEYRSFGLNTSEDFDREANLFKLALQKACDFASEKNAIGKHDNPLFWSLRDAFVKGDVDQVTKEMNYAFQNFLLRSRFSQSISATHRKIADFRFPSEWFPATRAVQRTIHLHVGPTNSGKTYNALKALENSKTGIYAGPLRLLAHEIYTRFMAKSKPCALITGEEQRLPEDEDTYFRSCTVEMTPLNTPVDVAVIDEIQMIGDPERGWAWTQAVLGVQAKDVHLCGEERSVELIQSLCDMTGDECVIHRYQRLSPLAPMDTSLHGSLKNLQKGDAIVAFSRVGIHALKGAVEKATGSRCAIVYGSLPPETRAQQAALFNDPNNDYDYLVASDAIGMGLNLEIRRVIFEQTYKRDKHGFRACTTSEIKQIGGRAGRYRTAASAIRDAEGGSTQSSSSQGGNIGLVTTLEEADLVAIHEAFGREPEQIKTAGIQAPPAVIERFASYFPPNTPFSYILLRLRDIGRISPRFHLCSPGEMLDVADLIQPYPMSVYDRCVFLNAPVFLRDHKGKEILQAFAKCVSNMEGGHVLDIEEFDLDIIDMSRQEYPGGPSEYLRRLEALHKAITLYLWMSYRYSGIFQSQSLAFHIKRLIEEKIDAHLHEISLDIRKRQARAATIRKEARLRSRKKDKLLGAGEEGVEAEGLNNGGWTDGGHEGLLEEPIQTAQGTPVGV